MRVTTNLNVTMRQLKIFEAVSRLLSYTRAAEELHLTQPAVSMQVKQVEQVVGAALFHQQGRRIDLTEVGTEVQRCARIVLAQLSETERVLEAMKRAERGSLTLGVTSTVNYFLTGVLGRFTAAYPGVSIRLEVTNRETLLEQLSVNEPDLVLMGQPPEDANLVFQAFMDNPLVIIAPRSHRLVRKRRVQLGSLSSEVFLQREAGSGTRLAMERVFAATGLGISDNLVMNSNEAIKQGVEAGLGLGFVSRHTVTQELQSKRLAELKVEGFPVMRRWFVVQRRDRVLSSVGEAFKQFLLEQSSSAIT